ncbi:MAG: VOC family protein [Arenicella sp.]
MTNAINWFELPTVDFGRAVKFYSEILGEDLQVMECDGIQMGMLPNFTKEQGVGGHISYGTDVQPSQSGTMVFLNGGDDLNGILNKVAGAGGEVVMPKTEAPGGYMGVFLDSEGNRVAIHNP